MYYMQFSRMLNTLDEKFVSDFDFWLATQPRRMATNITASFISNKFSVEYSMAKYLLEFAYKTRILEKYYLLMCEHEQCNMPIREITKEQLGELMNTEIECDSCDCKTKVVADNLFVVYKRVKNPKIRPEDLERDILNRTGVDLRTTSKPTVNFTKADSCAGRDSLAENMNDLNESVYSPSELAYKEMKRLYEALDYHYDTQKQKGDAYEDLVIYTIDQIKGISVTKQVTVYDGINQFDCTGVVQFICDKYPVMNYLLPTFIGECKNESSSVNNAYYSKLRTNIESNDSKVGILFSRKEAGAAMKKRAQLLYLGSRHEKPIILINISDNDWKEIIENRRNLLEVLMNKISEVTLGADQNLNELFKEEII